MATIRLIPVDPPDASPRTISPRLRTQLSYFTSPGAGPDPGPDEFRFDPAEVAKWLDDGVFYLVSPLDSANTTEVELTEEQEEFLGWLQKKGVRSLRVLES